MPLTLDTYRKARQSTGIFPMDKRFTVSFLIARNLVTENKRKMIMFLVYRRDSKTKLMDTTCHANRFFRPNNVAWIDVILDSSLCSRIKLTTVLMIFKTVSTSVEHTVLSITPLHFMWNREQKRSHSNLTMSPTEFSPGTRSNYMKITASSGSGGRKKEVFLH